MSLSRGIIVVVVGALTIAGILFYVFMPKVTQKVTPPINNNQELNQITATPTPIH